MADVEYTQIDGGIHKFVFSASSRQAVDDFVVKMDELLQTASTDDCMAFIIDLRPDGLPPITYTLGRFRVLFAKHPVQPQMFGAYLYQDNMLITLLSTFMDSLRLRSKRKLFNGDAEEEATQWLIDQIRAFR